MSPRNKPPWAYNTISPGEAREIFLASNKSVTIPQECYEFVNKKLTESDPTRNSVDISIGRGNPLSSISVQVLELLIDRYRQAGWSVRPLSGVHPLVPDCLRFSASPAAQDLYTERFGPGAEEETPA